MSFVKCAHVFQHFNRLVGGSGGGGGGESGGESDVNIQVKKYKISILHCTNTITKQ